MCKGVICALASQRLDCPTKVKGTNGGSLLWVIPNGTKVTAALLIALRSWKSFMNESQCVQAEKS